MASYKNKNAGHMKKNALHKKKLQKDPPPHLEKKTANKKSRKMAPYSKRKIRVATQPSRSPVCAYAHTH